MRKLDILERRQSRRKSLTGLLPGRLSIVDTDESLNCKPIDVSKDGIGILTSEILQIGTKLLLKTHSHAIILEVRWAQPDFGKHGLYRYGIIHHDPNIDLEDIFLKTKCIRTV